MRSLFASLVVAAFFMLTALVVTVVGALGVALIGLLLSRWFDLTQWQGSLIALVIASGLTVTIYRLANSPVASPAWTDAWEEDEEEEEEEPEVEEPPIVPWRRNRPTPGELPSEQASDRRGKSTSSSRRR